MVGLRKISKTLSKTKLAPSHHTPPRKTNKQTMIMVTVWWSTAGLIHYSFLNSGKTITSEKYAHQTDEVH